MIRWTKRFLIFVPKGLEDLDASCARWGCPVQKRDGLLVAYCLWENSCTRHRLMGSLSHSLQGLMMFYQSFEGVPGLQPSL